MLKTKYNERPTCAKIMKLWPKWGLDKGKLKNTENCIALMNDSFFFKYFISKLEYSNEFEICFCYLSL